MSDPVFLTIEQIKILHRLSLERHGGQEGVRDPATLESATMHPCNVWLYGQGDFFDIAAAYAFHIAEAQAFVDGNKRTGMGAALVFLEGNGFPVPAATEELYQAMIAIAERRMGKAGLADILRKLCGAP
ncbi:MAG: type II toxin-antitoxin system death-on-curing family toxin [Verrucomicrobiales bacterium]|nr:type II toxin-antitoxin system death-on-curing family toxin [Verrucomicrobiales bacterium]